MWLSSKPVHTQQHDHKHDPDLGNCHVLLIALSQSLRPSPCTQLSLLNTQELQSAFDASNHHRHAEFCIKAVVPGSKVQLEYN